MSAQIQPYARTLLDAKSRWRYKRGFQKGDRVVAPRTRRRLFLFWRPGRANFATTPDGEAWRPAAVARLSSSPIGCHTQRTNHEVHEGKDQEGRTTQGQSQ